jgi:hypothetical protein
MGDIRSFHTTRHPKDGLAIQLLVEDTQVGMVTRHN